MHEIKIQCPAKINLTLKITGKRPDGFHNLESIMQTISLYDYLNISVNPSEKSGILLSGNSNEIPYNEKNLVYKAAKLFLDEFKPDRNYEIDIYIDKNIPVAAGLAGGSTDAAGTLYGLNELFEKPFSREELHSLCAQLGSDLNFCLEGGAQLTTGRGEVLTRAEYKEHTVSLIKPINLGISAKEAYTKFARKHSFSDENRDKFINDLEWAIINDYPELQTIKNKYPLSVMSGSGSTYFILGHTFEQMTDYWVMNNLKTTTKGVIAVEPQNLP
ncbi:4-(cytidine 5'-diphospho)-2-C-methyl-D-erythritol kinase [bacterium]|nr:4-(cytidine 5'-diphospho)-2-C-methyl-D-erythritol kinase [bacterium]